MKYLDQNGLLYLWQKLKILFAGKVDKVEGKGLSTNDYTTAEKNKLAGIAADANNYVHPASHPASMIQMSDGKTLQSLFDGATQVTDWNTVKQPGVYYSTYDAFNKPNFLVGFDVYGIVLRHGEQVKQILTTDEGYEWRTRSTQSDGSTWHDWNDLIVPVSQFCNGLMQSEDKTKLDGIAQGANKTIVDSALSSTSTNPVQNKAVKAALDGKEESFTKNSAFNKNFGTAAGTVCQGNDSRLSDARPANGGNSSTVNGHSVLSDVPANAVFTDTTYSVATASKDGLMSKADFSKLSGFSAASNYALKSEITGVYKYKGSKATEADLPTTGNALGDVWNVETDSQNYAWDGQKWDSLGGVFEIISITNTEIDAIFAS